MPAPDRQTRCAANVQAFTPGSARPSLILLTGATGYVGSELLKALEARKEALDADIAGFDRGLLLVTPEYNNSIPGPFKNAIDWLSRPASDIARVFGGKPVALMGASPGRFGTLSAQTAWLPVFRVLGLRPWFATPLYISSVHKAMDEQHRLADPDTRERLRKFLAGFAAFVG